MLVLNRGWGGGGGLQLLNAIAKCSSRPKYCLIQLKLLKYRKHCQVYTCKNKTKTKETHTEVEEQLDHLDLAQQ